MKRTSFTGEETARIIGVTGGRVSQLIKAGFLKHVAAGEGKLGRNVSAKSIKDYLEARVVFSKEKINAALNRLKEAERK